MDARGSSSACPRCGREGDGGLGFCAHCGESLPAAQADAHPLDSPVHYAKGERVDDCEILGPPETGLLGERYPARDLSTSRDVELRVLRATGGVRPENVQRFRATLEAARSLRATGLRDLHRFSEEAGCFRLVLDAPSGEPLAQQLVGSSGAPRALARESARAVLDGVCAALERVHETSVHGKLWPSAIRVSWAEADRPETVWLDLPGEVWLQPDARIWAVHTPGSAAYVAPELLQGEAPAPPADLYAVGALAYELVTGRPPRGLAPPPSQIAARLAPSADQVIARCLAETPQGRYAGIADLRRDLNAALRESALRPVSEAPRVRSPEDVGVSRAWYTPPAGVAGQRAGRGGRVVSVLITLLLILGLAAGGLALYWQYFLSHKTAPVRTGPASLTIRTDPPGAMVNLDGRELGPAPLVLPVVSPDRMHFLRLSAPGHELEVFEVKLRPGEQRTMTLRLDPEPE